MNLRDTILSASDCPLEKVTVGEWGGVDVYVRTLSGAERDAFEMECAGGPGGMDNVRARLLVRTLADADGKPIFSADDVSALGRKSAKAMGRLFDIASRLNGLGKQDVAELRKN